GYDDGAAALGEEDRVLTDGKGGAGLDDERAAVLDGEPAVEGDVGAVLDGERGPGGDADLATEGEGGLGSHPRVGADRDRGGGAEVLVIVEEHRDPVGVVANVIEGVPRRDKASVAIGVFRVAGAPVDVRLRPRRELVLPGLRPVHRRGLDV